MPSLNLCLEGICVGQALVAAKLEIGILWYLVVFCFINKYCILGRKVETHIVSKISLNSKFLLGVFENFNDIFRLRKIQILTNLGST